MTNIVLPLNEVQKIQTQIRTKVKPLKHNDFNDALLSEAYRNGNEEAFKKLVYDYLDIISYVYRLPHKAQYKSNGNLFLILKEDEKEDLLQEILFHFSRTISEHDNEIGVLQGIVKGKLHLKVYNKFVEDLIDYKILNVHYSDTQNYIDKVGFFPTYFEEDKEEEISDKLQNALSQLSEKQRVIVEMSSLNGWNSTEIGAELGIAPATVRVTLSRGLKKLREIMITEEETA